MRTGTYLSINDIDETTWNRLNPSHFPGLLHGFLSALEDSGSVGEGTGWLPLYTFCEDESGPLGALVSYLKEDSYGEYVFDWAWADAYHRHGLSYYPKLVTAVPFTPATGPRVLLARGQDTHALMSAMTESLHRHLGAPISGWHVLFPDDASTEVLHATGHWMERHGVQFHWFNPGFEHFDDHLASFTSKRRKEARRERRRVAEQGIVFERLTGHDIDADALDVLYRCYQRTYAVRGRSGYLTRRFFELACQRIPDSIRVAFALYEGQRIAMSFCFEDPHTLYGRYWGALVDVDCLHFETCFHQWIEYAIEQGLSRFDPGAQGEHKIARGFKPVKTRSLHQIYEPEFAAAIGQFLRQEQTHIAHYMAACDDATPFKALDTPLSLDAGESSL